ncbi:MAG: HD domain-containing protein [Nitrososphaeraceae archaeon]|nr:HD domain-containing protein [Nitrososphaeraceae archaeon]
MVSITHIPDPIHGNIEIPHWLRKIINEKSVRRMMFIRQLGLKTYADFPGAIHTRYSHVLGVMHLGGRIVDMISKKERNLGNNEISTNLEANRNTIMAAGFLHDIGHGPFSHAIDYVLKKYANKTHEDIAFDIIDKLPDIENDGIIKTKVKDIIKGKHRYPFISQIINGPLDSDKLDYLLRDAYHVGLKYSLDLDHFINHFKILGQHNSMLEKCELGLSNDNQAIVTAEIFVVIWKSMYDLVYHVENSRIAEKMIEKAMLSKIKEDKNFLDYLKDIDKFIDLNDEKLFEILRHSGESKELVNRINDNNLYIKILEDELTINKFKFGPKFIELLISNPDGLSDKLTEILTNEMKCQDNELICDIIKSRAPKTINIDLYDENTGEQIDLKNRSEIVKAIKEKSFIKIYVKNNEIKSKVENLITPKLKDILKNWG